MTDDPTALQALRARHQPIEDGEGTEWCVHDDMLWPCDAALLGDVALAAAEFAELVDEDVLEWETQRGSDAARARLHAALTAVEEGRS